GTVKRKTRVIRGAVDGFARRQADPMLFRVKRRSFPDSFGRFTFHEQHGVLPKQLLFTDSPPDCIQQRLCLGRLDEIVHHSLLEQRSSSLDIGVSSHHDDGHRRKLLPDECDEIIPVHLRQINVADNCMDWETSGIGLDRGNGFFTVSSFKYFVATLFQHEADCFSNMLFVINNEYSPHEHTPPRSAYCEMIAHFIE